MKAEEIEKLILLLGNTSLPEETEADWADWVCEPIIKHMLAPRWGKAALEQIGIKLDEGKDIRQIILKILET